jgi:hypothetical protein
MQNFGDWKSKNSTSPILEALNRGSMDRVSTFGSVDQFIAGLLGSNFNAEPHQDPASVPSNETNPKFKEELKPQEEIEDPVMDQSDDEDEEEELENSEESETDKSLYKIYRDKEEIFECNISVQGAKLSSSQVRLIFDHEICNLVFYGKISKDGKCVVPLKKMNFYPERSTGRVRLEVIVDDTIFIPWEETFIVEGAKKVTVQIKSQKKVDFRF